MGADWTDADNVQLSVLQKSSISDRVRYIQGKDSGSLVPHLPVAFGIVLALVSLGVLIHFIHHIAKSIQAENVVAAVERELEDAIDGLFPKKGPH